MAKKRVSEITKDLQAQGVDLDNKGVVVELKALGYDVKSHSSSLEDDQAVAAIQKMLEKRQPKAAPAPVAPKGFVVRRRVGENVQQTVQPPPQADAPLPPDSQTPVATVLPPPPEVVAAPEPAIAAAVAAPPPAEVVAVAAAAASAPRASAPRVRASAPRASAATVVAPPPVAAPPVTAVPPMVRPRASAPRPTGAGATATGPATPVAPPPRPQVPTANQAVVLSRPLIAVKRVTPTQPRAYPAAPGKRAVGAVREFKVVPNRFGAGPRDFVDVSRAKDKEKEKPGQRRSGRGKDGPGPGEGSTSTDLRAIVFGRIAIPIRGKKKKPTKKGMKTLITEMAGEKKVVKVQEGISVTDLGQRMGVKTNEIIRKLMQAGKMVTANALLEADTASIIASDYGWTVKKVGMEVEDFLPQFEDNDEDQVRCPPVVTVMGHVDHGKTSLLDAIRSASVVTGEAGGITQHIGAYTVKSPQGGDITFLDTPGHEAFSAMRMRGANITDLVVLVVAADDGVMPQTKEAINHAQKAEVPIVVAVNKMDLTGANMDRVKKDLATHGLLAEDWGGEVIVVPVSAKTREGVDLLLENISLQAEVLELKANPKRPAQGTVLEARVEKGRGPVATVLVEAGTLRKGDAIVTGTHFGRVRMMLNDKGDLIDEVLPGYSAEVIGLSGVPTAGDVIHAVADEKAAKSIADYRSLKLRQAEAGKTSRETLDDLLNRHKKAEQKDLKLVLKADVSGSLEAVADALVKLATPKVKVSIVQKGVGMITETDINNAAAFGALVVGFNVRPESGAEAAARAQEVKWETFGIIYELLDGVIVHMEDLLEPVRVEKKLGRAEVRNLFNVPRLGVVAGSAVTEGVIKRSAFLRLLRENKQIHQGKIASLKRFKDDVREVAMGMECGIGVQDFTDLQPGDIIEAFEVEEIRPSLN